MLDSIRKRKDNIIYSGIILATAAVMGFYGIGQLKDNRNEGGVAAWINGEPVSQQELNQEMERRIYQYQTMFGGQFDPQMLGPDFPKQVLEQLLRSKLLIQQAQKMSMIVTDEELADFIRSIPAYQKNGKFDTARYTQIPNRGLLERSWRERLQLSKFQDYLSGRVRLTPRELDTEHLLKETKIDLFYARIDFQELAKNQKPSAKALSEFEKVTASTQYQAYYDTHKLAFYEKPRMRLRQIRVGIPYQASEAQRSAAEKKIDSIYSEVTATNFADIAKKRSDDEFASKGGDTGWIDAGTLEKPLEDAIEKLQPGEISPAVHSAFGHFIFQLTERKEGVQQSLDQVRSIITERLYREKLTKDFSESTHKRWNELLATGKDIGAELKSHGVEIKKTGPFSIGQAEIPGIGSSDNVLDAIFELTRERPLAKNLVFFQDNYYYIKLATLEPARSFNFAKDLDSSERLTKTKVEDSVLKSWVAQLEKRANKKVELKFSNPSEPTAVQ